MKKILFIVIILAALAGGVLIWRGWRRVASLPAADNSITSGSLDAGGFATAGGVNMADEEKQKLEQIIEEYRAEEEKIKMTDSDLDGLSNDEESVLGTKADAYDTDADGLSDYDEVKRWKTDPLKSDTDGDGYADGEEVYGGFNPLGKGKLNQ